ncbi:hypothetical protein KCU73_g89, partial [Aureobasidium melanogenum]
MVGARFFGWTWRGGLKRLARYLQTHLDLVAISESDLGTVKTHGKQVRTDSTTPASPALTWVESTDFSIASEKVSVFSKFKEQRPNRRRLEAARAMARV